MNRADECKYNVIQFLEAPYKDLADYVCVPRSWVQSRGPDDRKVRVSYPDEKSSATERRVKNTKKKLEQWKSYLSVVKHKTDSYDEAKLYIQGLIPEMWNADNTLSSAKVLEKPRRCARFATRSAKTNIIDALELSPTSNNNLKSTNETTLKRKALTDPDKEANKRSRVTELDGSDDEVAEPSSQALQLTSEDQPLTPEVSDEDLCTQELPDEETNDRNNTENRSTVNPNPSETNHSMDPEIIGKQDFIGEFFRCVRELQTNLQIYTSSLFTETVNKFMNNVGMCSARRYNCSIATPTKNTTQESQKLNEKKRNAEKDDDGAVEDVQTLEKKRFPKRIKKVVLPPEYDENDSRWVLKYRKPAPGLVELMPHTGVYVEALSLTNCKRLSKDCKTLARMLLTEIFTTSALSTCSWTGTRAKAFDRDGTNVRPGLNEHARKVLLNYVAVCAEKEGWNNYENQTILSSVRNKMQEMRCKYES